MASKVHFPWRISIERNPVKASSSPLLSNIVSDHLDLFGDKFVNRQWLEAVEQNNRANVGAFLRPQDQRLIFRELQAEHDRFFEAEATMLNGSIYSPTIGPEVSGQIAFRERWMAAAITIETNGFPLPQGDRGTVKLKIVPADVDTIRILRAAAEQYPTVRINLGGLILTVSTKEDRTMSFEVRPFQAQSEWRSDIYESPVN